MATKFDVIIVGGGSAGCVLASRLSEKSALKVLLVEAGNDTPPGQEPADIADVYPSSYYNPSNMWPGLNAYWRTKSNSSPTNFPQGRVMGGGSSVMGMIALRGVPDDFNSWERAGAEGWNWSNVLPYFQKLESDSDFNGELHGNAGPVPIRRIAQCSWPPLSRAIAEFADARKYDFIDDMNADFRDGYCVLPMSNRPERRASAAMCYLTPSVRARPNLTILTNAHVAALEMDGNRAVGIRALIEGETITFTANQVILSAGAIHSPMLLLQAGIGPAEQIVASGLEVTVNRRGVGANLQNHALLFIAMHLRKNSRQPAALRTHPVTCFRYSSNMPGAPESDMYINIQSKTSWNSLGRQIGNLAPVLWAPFSRGRVSLSRQSGGISPLIEFNFLDDERDTKRLCDAYRLVLEILAFDAIKDLVGRPFAVAFSDRIRKLNRLSASNKLKAGGIARMLDLVPGISDHILARLSGRKMDLFSLADDTKSLKAFVKQNVAGMFHVAGTCRMGSCDDPDAVVDSHGSVIGITGLKVIDASIMPSVPRGNTNIPTIMIAEKMADIIKNEVN